MSINVIQLVQLAIILLVSIWVHEYAHAWTSDKLGDPTPKMMGRLTPNPLAHIDPLGFLMIFIINFGWGKSVITNPAYYRQPLRDECLVAFAWPISNIILACVGVMITIAVSQTDLIITSPGLINFWEMFALINCGLAVFNMIPLPPLDGWRLVKVFAPQWAGQVQQLTYQYMWATMLLLLVWSRFISPFIQQISYWLYNRIHMIFSALFFLF